MRNIKVKPTVPHVQDCDNDKIIVTSFVDSRNVTYTFYRTQCQVAQEEMESVIGPQLQMWVELLSQVFFPIFLVVVIVSVYYETLYFYRFCKSGLTLKQIRSKKENSKENSKIEKKDFNTEVLEEVTIDKKETANKI